MNLSNKLKRHINDTGAYNISALSRLSNINRLHFHLWLSGSKELQTHELNGLLSNLKKIHNDLFHTRRNSGNTTGMDVQKEGLK